jgi:DNA-binding FadR family transcriptional regulator
MSELSPPADAFEEVVEGLPEPKRLGQQLAALLAAEIVSGRIGAGEAFPSADAIVNRYRVSRTVVRETVQTLGLLGLVRLHHGKRPEVLPDSEWDVLASTVQQALRAEGKADELVGDLYEFRLLIEPRAAYWMADHGSDEHIAALGELATRMEALSKDERAVAQVLHVDRRFHDLVAAASGNRVLAAVSRDIREVLATAWVMTRLSKHDLRKVAAQHRRISDAIASRDADEAMEAMHDHLIWASQADIQGKGERPAERRK